jgi:DNA invertase Pin-like site-specific DNA recombinase
MAGGTDRRPRRCATYTRKSSEEGLEQDFNSLDAQREACEAYIRSQAGEGWKPVRARYDDGGHSGGTLQRPGLERMLADIETGKIDTVVVYKVDRLTRSLADFAKIVEIFDAHGVSFVSVTQQFNTTTSMGRLTLNMLLSFAQFEREVTGERIRDKIAASKRKGLWMGGYVPLGYEPDGRTQGSAGQGQADEWWSPAKPRLHLPPPQQPALHWAHQPSGGAPRGASSSDHRPRYLGSGPSTVGVASAAHACWEAARKAPEPASRKALRRGGNGVDTQARRQERKALPVLRLAKACCGT